MGGSSDGWVYHGVINRSAHKEQPRIFVEQVAFGPTERQRATVLRELAEPSYGGFLWGYAGGSPTRASEAILADALELANLAALDTAGKTVGDERLPIQLRNDFTDDVLSQLCDEWRIRRGVVLRWVRAWYAEHGLDSTPGAALDPPAISRHS